MCGFCGLWGETAHWSSASGIGRARSGSANLKLRARILQQASIDRVAAHVGISVKDWNGSSWLVSSPQGATAIVGSLPEVWIAIEGMTSREIDPLSTAVIDAVSRGRWQSGE